MRHVRRPFSSATGPCAAATGRGWRSLRWNPAGGGKSSRCSRVFSDTFLPDLSLSFSVLVDRSLLPVFHSFYLFAFRSSSFRPLVLFLCFAASMRLCEAAKKRRNDTACRSRTRTSSVHDRCCAVELARANFPPARNWLSLQLASFHPNPWIATRALSSLFLSFLSRAR